MELVQVEDTLDLKDRFTDLTEGNVGGNTLKEDVGSTLNQWHGRGEDDYRNDKRDDGVKVVLEPPRCLPDDKASSDHTNIS